MKLSITMITMIIVSIVFLSCSLSIVKGEITHEIESLMNEIEYLHSKGVDVKPIIDMLNKAIESSNKGEIGEAYLYINEARDLI
ncbi:MAG: hypothetical protein QXE81_01930, partial [Desulfurococcaceae archaeon]